MTDERPKIDYVKKRGDSSLPKRFTSYASDPTLNPYAFEEYPMPMIYDRDDSNDYDIDDIADIRRQHDEEYDRNAPTATLTGKQILGWSTVLALVLLILIAAANLA